MIDESTQALAALRGETPELTLYWYEEVKKDLGFDPEASGPMVEDPQPWNLEDEYPLSLQDQVQALAAAMNWTGQDLSRQKELMAWLHEKERSDADGNAPPQQTGSAEEHPGPPAGGAAAQAAPEHSV